jgi:cellulose synthase/poly-beta-1,6-N-acetylglucosamine synthase-like glycosyltransferase
VWLALYPTLATVYQLTLLAAAAAWPRGRRAGRTPAGEPLRMTVLVPAHDEELSLPATLASLLAVDYPRDRCDFVVIADNCVDRTADIAREAGATVLERHDSTRLGKGHALAWALERLSARTTPADAVVVVDADCTVTPNLLRSIDRRLRAGESAVQTSYSVANPDDSAASALRFAAFALVNTVRPLGKTNLGLSAGLLGTGMGFTAKLLEDHPWRAFTVTEDAEYQLRLILGGRRVAFAPEAGVASPMPTSLAASRDQNLRWEAGKWRLMRRFVVPLLRQGLRRRDAASLNAAFELILPPQSILMAANAALVVVALRRRVGMAVAAFDAVGQAAYVLGGLAVVRAPASAYRAMLAAPALAAWKLLLHARVLSGRGPRQWIRTSR